MKEVEIYTIKMCPYCKRAKKLLEKKGVSFKELRTDENPDLVTEAIERSGGIKTVPQIFIEGQGI